ncbi:glycosyltransferase family 32 protein [Polynucleobacter sphagniphilus]|jgi:hypothetical protein|uniref:Glycosyl transferase n=1 Tax=Polynucleobacter sphagniphilus TaxID=1743169 RepID=A0AA43M9L5_9BURK|nr:glycosyltransferase [Polynucleobacter sphagniphilus]MDH6504706.1 hypothetical protein [Polynucleobacter sphagniphilus]MDH6513341.1 hypothetical protein [Polynucleobacter sphagniphilus]
MKLENAFLNFLIINIQIQLLLNKVFMQISQIYLSANNDSLSPYLLNCVESVKSHFPNWKYVLYNMHSAREYIASKFGVDTLNAFDKLKPYSYKADLFRYCVLYAEGGWYFDISVKLVSTFSVDESIETFACKDTSPSDAQAVCYCCSTALLYSKPNSSVYLRAINEVINNCNNEYYGINPLSPSGPFVLGRSFALEGESRHRIFGEYLALTPNYKIQNYAWLAPNGQILGTAKPSEGGNLAALGATGTNNYYHLYYSKSVYKK